MVRSSRRSGANLRGPEYRVRTVFRAPRRFVYGWCTDFGPEDPNLEHEHYERRIVERTPRRVIYEDLESSVGCWSWARKTVRLRPPAQWHL